MRYERDRHQRHVAVKRIQRASWHDRAGAWLGIGSAPAALVLGAGLAARHGGAIPVIAIVLGVVVMAVILGGQGALGMAPPRGAGKNLTDLAPAYLPDGSHKLLSLLLAGAMIGWFGFNVGLGGAAVASMLGLPDAVGALIIGVPVWAISDGSMRRWNAAAVVATVATLLLGAVIAVGLNAPLAPVTLNVPSTAGVVADVAAFIGYVSVFGIRAPDFSVGLERYRDLGISISLLIVPLLIMGGVGAMLYRSTGSTDLIQSLSGASMGWGLGNLLVAIAVIGPAFTTTYSGALALRSLGTLSDRYAITVIAGVGLLLAVFRFDLYLLPWLAALAAALPALVVPMALEGFRRVRGGTHRMVPVWTWAPASGLAITAMLLGQSAAPVLALAVAGMLSAAWLLWPSRD